MASTQTEQHVILFYKYTPLSSNKDVMVIYQNAMESLCSSLKLTGRVLIGQSENEGLNGTLAGEKEHVLNYTFALMGKQWCFDNHPFQNVKVGEGAEQEGFQYHSILNKFWEACGHFSEIANVPIPQIDSPDDFKWSSVETDQTMFPDLQIKLVKEIISTGGVLSSIPIQDTSKDYLTPKEWHHEMQKMKMNGNDDNTVLIDCRNHKEFAVGHFENAIDPNTKNFAQFPRWVQENKSSLQDKKVLMYCTGGIRCEKASAYIRKEMEGISVHHLKGGIHKYLDEYSNTGFFNGKNFVFDKRLVVNADEHKISKDKDNSSTDGTNKIVGKCQYCEKCCDAFSGDGVCTVCRELSLVCEECKSSLRGEYHCADHMHLKNCYFTNLSMFSQEELQSQLEELQEIIQEIAVGKRFKQKRQTLKKQSDRILERLSSGKDIDIKESLPCRSCSETSCNGECWGVHGLKRKNALEKAQQKPKKSARLSANQRASKVLQKEKEIDEIVRLKLSEPPHVHRNNITSIRCPPPCIRILTSSVKGKWCGRTIKSVLQTEFHDLSDSHRLEEIFMRSLIKINGIPVNSDLALRRGTEMNKAHSPDTLLKNMDTISRILHWHEPPVIVPDKIEVKCIKLPKIVCDKLLSPSDKEDENDDYNIYYCDKPSTVPVHPAGPYYQNSLLLMVEAQQDLSPRSLLPCHRLDRCTSGLTICCTNPKVARLLQVQMDIKAVKKMYLARVKGKFPACSSECNKVFENNLPQEACWSWCDSNTCVVMDAPIDILDIQKGLRCVKGSGKASKSKFKYIEYDVKSDTSLISCCPLTGRQHQLRVHLQALGFPIHNDNLYGGMVKNTDCDQMKMDAIESIINSHNDDSKIKREKGITQETAKDAREVCLCCKGSIGIQKCFNASQLLESGHAICLHALKYRINFINNKKSNSQQPLAMIELSVSPPLWADLNQESTELLNSWLEI